MEATKNIMARDSLLRDSLPRDLLLHVPRRAFLTLAINAFPLARGGRP